MRLGGFVVCGNELGYGMAVVCDQPVVGHGQTMSARRWVGNPAHGLVVPTDDLAPEPAPEVSTAQPWRPLSR